jgi:hypothetical protein
MDVNTVGIAIAKHISMIHGYRTKLLAIRNAMPSASFNQQLRGV